jgi:hydroxyethylthiazole kinase
MGIAGEIAAENAQGPGSFRVRFIDALHAIRENDIRTRLQAAAESR